MSGPNAPKARLFFALWPDDALKARLAALGREAQAQCGGRAVPAGKIHVTLFFVGSIERARTSAMEAIGASVHAEPFDLVLDTVRYWRRSGIVWAGAQSCPPALQALAASLRAALAAENVHEDDRPYVPHVTLVRDAQRAPKALEVTPLEWRVEDFVLVESVASRYEVKAAWRL